jgi:hypothetical protein
MRLSLAATLATILVMFTPAILSAQTMTECQKDMLGYVTCNYEDHYGMHAGSSTCRSLFYNTNCDYVDRYGNKSASTSCMTDPLGNKFCTLYDKNGRTIATSSCMKNPLSKISMCDYRDN